MVNPISRRNFKEVVLPKLNESQTEVYNLICFYPNGINSKKIEKILGKQHHKFSGRLTELVDKGLIIVSDITEIDECYVGVWMATKYII